MISADHAILLIHCPDVKGIVHSVTDFVLTNDGNIVKLDQHVDEEEGRFFMRVQWDLGEFSIPRFKIAEYFQTLVASRYGMTWQLRLGSQVPRVALFVSKYAHCFFDIISRHEAGELKVDIPLIISNHKKFEGYAARMGIPYYYFPITGATKEDIERQEIQLLREHQVDLIILARYMQIISPAMIEAFPQQIINIHHSSLPAFAGADPYSAAFKRGVKFMGATSHYVTEDLDEGPIIAQDVIPITHRDSIADMKRRGKDIEKTVLAKAIYAHCTHNVLTYNNKTVVFD